MYLGVGCLSRRGNQLRSYTGSVIFGDDADSLGGSRWHDARVCCGCGNMLFALEALSAKDGSPLGWFEGYGGLDAALGALGACLGA